MRLPTKISPSPLVEASADIRFEPNTHPDAVFGMVYAALDSKKYTRVEKLPILQLPEEIRRGTPQLESQPHYRILSENFGLQIGPRVCALSTLEYPGWTAYSAEVKDVMQTLVNASIIRKIDRIGLRYINFFTQNVFEFSTFRLTFNGEAVVNPDLHIRTVLPFGKHRVTVQTTNQAYEARLLNQRGSVVDLDASETGLNLTSELVSTTTRLIETLHSSVKECFFASLQTDFLSSLSPEFD